MSGPELVSLALVLAILYGGYVWFIRRVVVGADKVLVVLKNDGSRRLEGEQIIMPRPPDQRDTAAYAPGVPEDEALNVARMYQGLAEAIRTGQRVEPDFATGQQMLQAFGRSPRSCGGDGIAILAWQVGQQAGDGAFYALPAGRAAEEWRTWRQRGRQFQQRGRTGLRDSTSCHKHRDSLHWSTG
ncbi:MAG TPA: hypothetical protein VIH59_23210 [Candidatus Tectomicrobia bacterium]